MAPPSRSAVAELAEAQGGHVTRRQLLDLGLGSAAIQHRLSKGELIRVYHGVYALGHLPKLPVDRAKGAVLACGESAALSHSSAAALWGFFSHWQLPFEVVAANGVRRRGIRIHHPPGLRFFDLRAHLAIRTTSPARTILDIAPRVSGKRLRRIVNDARLAKLVTVPELAATVHRLPRHPGASRLKLIVDLPTGPTRSELEDRFLAFCKHHGLPQPKINAKVAGYEVDALFEAQKLIIELDGYSTHSDRDTFEADRERDVTTLVAGFATVRLTDQRMRCAPRREASRLLAILEPNLAALAPLPREA